MTSWFVVEPLRSIYIISNWSFNCYNRPSGRSNSPNVPLLKEKFLFGSHYQWERCGYRSAKIAAVAQWPTPSNAKELRSFLGLAGYYRNFVRNYGIICKPLTELLKKHSLFVWTQIHEDSFFALKKCFVSVTCTRPTKFFQNILCQNWCKWVQNWSSTPAVWSSFGIK